MDSLAIRPNTRFPENVNYNLLYKKIRNKEMIRETIAIFLLFFSLNTIAQFSKLSIEEQRLATIISRYQTSQLNLLARLVNINSGTHHIEGVHRVGEILKNELMHLGFSTQ